MAKGRGRGVQKPQGFQIAPDSKRIISLGGGTWAYINDDKGKLKHLQRDSSEFALTCKQVDAILEGKISNELTALGWTDVLAAMDEITLETED